MTNATLELKVIKASLGEGQVKASVQTQPAVVAKLHAGPKGDKGDAGGGIVTAVTGANSVGYGELQGATDGSNNVFTVQEGAFEPGSARPYFGEMAARIGPSQFTADPGNGQITLTFFPTEPIMLDYVPA